MIKIFYKDVEAPRGITLIEGDGHCSYYNLIANIESYGNGWGCGDYFNSIDGDCNLPLFLIPEFYRK